ncbi:MAG: NERD domain-containing protein [Chloroflexi bacterium]|nr:NERD domain-containing protein [Chloroflexota bacterium]MCC6897087.1 NERD domain-containing protein [Anaerolineae bacterium]
MENIAPVRALTRRSRQLLQIAFIILAIGVLMVVVGALLTTILLIPRTHQLFGLYDFTGNALIWLGAIVILISLGTFARALTRRKENDLAYLTGDVLNESAYFDGRYSFIRNINRSGLGYIDAVLVGPPGALVFRILNSTGNYANEVANWLKQDKQGEWLPFTTNPTKEAVDDIQHLRDYLLKNRLETVPVFGIIVFTAGAGAVQIAEKNPVVPISHLHSLLQNLSEQYLAKQDRIPQETVTAVRRLLLE